MSKVLITGATGLIGSMLCKALIARGHQVNVLTRRIPEEPKVPIQYYEWDIAGGKIDKYAFEGVTSVVHLAGAGIADKRWTDSRKKEIVESRVLSAELLVKSMISSGLTFDSFVTASGANYYGTQTSEEIYTESDPPGVDFLADCCLQWEHAAFNNNPAKRVVALRTGVALSPKGGALEKLAAPIKLGAGAALGSGKQYVPWIHIDDLVNLYCEAVLNPNYIGSYNAVASEHLSQKQLTLEIAKIYEKRIWLPNVPAFLLEIALGEMSEVILEGSRLSNERVLKTGFSFKYPGIEGALKNLTSTL